MKFKIRPRFPSKKIRRKIFKWLVILLACFIFLSVIPVVIYKYLPVPYTPLMVINQVKYKSENKKVKLRKEWVPLDDISIYLQLAAIAAEDDRFIEHSGFDFDAIQQAYKNNKKGKGRLRGGSTISQQTAKNVFLWPGRSYIRKGLEAYFTVLIEIIWGKERIMEVYLNIVETGKGVYGAEASARHFFGKHASELNRNEAAAIISVLPSPRKYSVTKPSSFMTRYRAAIVRRMMRMENLLDLENYTPNQEQTKK